MNRRRLYSAVAGFLALLVLLALPASAHAQLVATTPGIGAEVSDPPTSVTLSFDQGVTDTSRSVVVTADGRRLDNGAPFHPGGDPTSLSVTLTGGPDRASYDVVWRVGSADGHAIDGGFSFGVGQPAGPAPSTSSVAGSTAVAVIDDALQSLAYAGMVLALGAALVVGALWPAAAGSTRVRQLIALGWGLEVLATLGLFLLRGPVTAGAGPAQILRAEGVGDTISTRSGRLLLARLVIFALVLPALRRLLGRGSGAAVDLAVLTVLAALTFPLGDHAGTGSGAPLAVTFGTLHVLAASVWLGGLALLTSGLLKHGAGPQPVDLHRWSRVAAGCVAVLVVTGLAASYHEVGSWQALVGTRYGTVLFVKTGLTLGLLFCANLARRGVSRKSQPAALRAGVAVETGIALVVLGVTSVLVATQPADEAYPAPTSLSLQLDGSKLPLTAQIHLDRTRIGAETVTVSITDSAGRPVTPTTVDGIAADKSYEDDPVRFPFVAGNPGHYTGTLEVPETGSWRLAIEVRGGPAGDYAGETTYRVS